MPFAILRTAKLSSLGNVGGSASHNFRERNTPNADPARTLSNRTTGAQSTKEVIEAVKGRLETVPTVRKNAVLAIEYFIGASPEWFKEQSKNTREAYFDEAEKWLAERHGAENVIAFTRQYDETSPHVCAYVVPIDPKGKLNCSHFLDGRTKLSEMQTEFAEKVGQVFGLERGIEGSGAKHVTIKQYYAQIQAPTPQVKTQIPREPQPLTVAQRVAELVGVQTQHSQAQAQRQAAFEQRNREIVAQRQVQQSKAQQYDLEKAANAARNARLAELRSTATQARQLPLESVLERLGCIPDPRDRKNWRTPAGRLTVDGVKFYAHDQAKGGGGAIDLVMLIEQTDYSGAINHLGREFGTGAALEQAVATLKPKIEKLANLPPKPYQLPQRCPENWPRVLEYLTKVRRLGVGVMEQLHERGKVYADRFSNAVFVLGKSQGVELRGTGEKAFHGVRGEKEAFTLEAKDPEKRQVAFVESAIDAVSLSELGFKGKIVSLSGNSAAVAKAKAAHYRSSGLTVVAAFDNDRAGDKMALHLGTPCERLKSQGKDWNDDLKRERATPQERLALDQAEQARQKMIKHQRSGPSLDR